jgi:nucleoside 2-deoxyribosyltransferase
VDPIIEKIQTSDVLVADITKLNFNVMYEIGYAIGKSKRVLLIQNGTIISHALEKETLILQYLDEVVPLDYRDAVSSYSSFEQIDRYISEFASRSMAKTLSGDIHDSKESDSRLSKFPIGEPA